MKGNGMGRLKVATRKGRAEIASPPSWVRDSPDSFSDALGFLLPDPRWKRPQVQSALPD